MTMQGVSHVILKFNKKKARTKGMEIGYALNATI